LRTALLYGADAVYIGIAGLSLRSPSAEMSLADLATGVSGAHARKVKVYAAIKYICPQCGSETGEADDSCSG